MSEDGEQGYRNGPLNVTGDRNPAARYSHTHEHRKREEQSGEQSQDYQDGPERDAVEQDVTSRAETR